MSRCIVFACLFVLVLFVFAFVDFFWERGGGGGVRAAHLFRFEKKCLTVLVNNSIMLCVVCFASPVVCSKAYVLFT